MPDQAPRAPKVLFLSAYTPSLVSGAGAKTTFHEMLAVHRAFGVHLGFFGTDYEAQFLQQSLQECRANGVESIEPIQIGRFLPLVWILLLFWLPSSYARRFSLGTLIRLWRKDYRAVYVRDGQALLVGVLLAKLKGVPVIASQADVLVQMGQRSMLGAKGLLARAFWTFEYWKLRFWEPVLLRSAKACLVQSGKDAILLSELVPSATVRSFQPYLINNLQFAPAAAGRKRVVFWGALNRRENEDAVHFYAERIHPLVLRAVPDCQFVVAGISPSANVLALESPSVEVTGFLDDPSEVFNSAMVAVVPLRMGAGIKVKTIECLMMGLPTVATTVGAEGIDLGELDGLHVRDTEGEFAETVIRLLESNARSHAADIRQHVMDQFSFERSVQVITTTTREFAKL